MRAGGDELNNAGKIPRLSTRRASKKGETSAETGEAAAAQGRNDG